MVSIGIPVYNQDVTELVHTLHQQARELGQPFEILCYDDQSERSYHQANQKLKSLPEVHYQRLKENIGVCRLRNRLVEEAHYGNVLLIDSDMKVIRDDYLKSYHPYFNTGTVIFGGIRYEDISKKSPRYFRWYYGKQREAKSAEQRRQSPYLNFMSQHFLVPRTVYQDIRFEERLPVPGHDDTLFGYWLKQSHIPIDHIDNPMIHTRLPTVDEFLEKTRQSLFNLHRILSFSDVSSDRFQKHVRLLRTAQRLQQGKLSLLYQGYYRIFRPVFLQNFRSRFPSLTLFDLYRLGLWFEISKTPIS